MLERFGSRTLAHERAANSTETKRYVDYLGFGPIIDGKLAFMNIADLALVSGGAVLGFILVRNRARARQRRAG